MRLLFTSHNAELEGAPLNCMRLATWLQRRGHICRIVSPRNGPLLQLASMNGVQTDLMDGLYAEMTPSHFGEKLELHQTDVVFVNTILGGPLVRALKHNRPEQPVVWCIHESEVRQLASVRPYINSDTFSLPDVTVFVSEETQKAYRYLLQGRNEVIHNGIDLEEIDHFRSHHSRKDIRQQYGFADSAFVVLLVGSICPRKGQKEFIESAMQVMERMSDTDDVHFVIAGKLWPDLESYLSHALEPVQMREMADRIHVLPERDNIFELYEIADVLVCNSFIESLPTVILEAMGFGLPVVAGSCYGIREQIQDDYSGLLYLPGHISMLADRLLTLMHDPVLRTRLGAAARSEVEKRFSSERMTDAYESLLESLTTE